MRKIIWLLTLVATITCGCTSIISTSHPNPSTVTEQLQISTPQSKPIEHSFSLVAIDTKFISPDEFVVLYYNINQIHKETMEYHIIRFNTEGKELASVIKTIPNQHYGEGYHVALRDYIIVYSPLIGVEILDYDFNLVRLIELTDLPAPLVYP